VCVRACMRACVCNSSHLRCLATTLSFTINHDTYFDCRQFSDIHISQGSVVTDLRFGGKFVHDFVANLPLSLSVKEFENRLIFGEVMGKSLVSCFFDSRCTYSQLLSTV